MSKILSIKFNNNCQWKKLKVLKSKNNILKSLNNFNIKKLLRIKNCKTKFNKIFHNCIANLVNYDDDY